MKNNKGFTLVELVVVIALMAIIAGVSSYMLSAVTNQELKDFANNYDSMLSQCQIETMSGMQNPVLELTQNNDGEYMATLYRTVIVEGNQRREVVKSQYLGEDPLICFYNVEDDSQTFNLGRYERLSLTFDRSTGEITTKIGNNAYKITRIGAIDKRNLSYGIDLVPETGYHKVVN